MTGKSLVKSKEVNQTKQDTSKTIPAVMPIAKQTVLVSYLSAINETRCDSNRVQTKRNT